MNFKPLKSNKKIYWNYDSKNKKKLIKQMIINTIKQIQNNK